MSSATSRVRRLSSRSKFTVKLQRLVLSSPPTTMWCRPLMSRLMRPSTLSLAVDELAFELACIHPGIHWWDGEVVAAAAASAARDSALQTAKEEDQAERDRDAQRAAALARAVEAMRLAASTFVEEKCRMVRRRTGDAANTQRML